MNYGGAYRATPETLRVPGARPRTCTSSFNLIVNKEQRIPDIAWFTGQPDPVSTERTLLRHGQEFHTSFWGHLGAARPARATACCPTTPATPDTAAASLSPTNADVADLRARRARSSATCILSTRARPRARRPRVPGRASSGRSDRCRSTPRSARSTTTRSWAAATTSRRARVWYRLLNCGFRIPAGAGTDAMTNFASLRGPVGPEPRVREDRRCARLRPRSSPGSRPAAAWRPTGRSSSSHCGLAARAGREEPGDELALAAGRHTLEARVALRSIVPVDKLEIVRNGEVVARCPLAGERTSRDATVRACPPRARAGTCCARLRATARATRCSTSIRSAPRARSTSRCGGAPVRSAGDAAYFLALDRPRARRRRGATGWNTATEKQEAQPCSPGARGLRAAGAPRRARFSSPFSATRRSASARILSRRLSIVSIWRPFSQRPSCSKRARGRASAAARAQRARSARAPSPSADRSRARTRARSRRRRCERSGRRARCGCSSRRC